jgi:sortase B
VEEDFYKDHQYFTIYTEEHAYRYQIFAFYEIEETGDIYTIGFGPNEEYRKFVDNMKARSYYDTGVGVTEQDKVVTLSTCSSEGKRFVVNAKRVEVK